MGFLLRDQPVQVRPTVCSAGHHGAVQVQRSQQLGEMAGLVVLSADLEVIQQVPAVLGGTQEVNPAAVGAAGPASGLAIRGHRP